MKHLRIPAFLVFLSVASLFLLGNSRNISKPYRTEQAVNSPTPEPVVHGQDNTAVSNRIQIALILDTSNSMDGLIRQAKSQLFNIVNELVKARRDSAYADVEIALYEYGNDNLSVSHGYIRKVLDFTTSLDDISEKLFSLKTNGGSEYCGQVIYKSLEELQWTESDSALKVIYIAGNEGYDQGPLSYKEASASAKQNNTIVNTIFCGPYDQGIYKHWKAGATLTGGTYMNIDSDHIVVMQSSPYDSRIEELNIQLNNTYIYYGEQGRTFKTKQEAQDKNQKDIAVGNSVVRAKSKSSRLYDNSRWDLVDAYKSDSTSISKVDNSTLPEDLKTKSKDELKTIVVEKQNERLEIQKEINTLFAKREAYIASNADTTNSSTLGDNMVKTIRTQAKKKGFYFEVVNN